jgi:hypothetical protein
MLLVGYIVLVRLGDIYRTGRYRDYGTIICVRISDETNIRKIILVF